jgi:hypothetical protein
LENATHEDLAARFREVREDLYGEHGAQFLADDLGVSLQTWTNYESCIVMPAKIVLNLIVTMNVNPGWLLSGKGEKYGR